MHFYLSIIIVISIIPPSFHIIQLTFDRFPPRHPNRFRGPFNPLLHRPPNRPRYPFRPSPNNQQRPSYNYPQRPPYGPPYGSPPRPNGHPNFQPMAHINRPPGTNYQQTPYRNTSPAYQIATTTTQAATTSTTTTTTDKYPLESVENVNTLLSSMENDGTLQESGWPKGKVKPMLKELWPHYQNVKSMLLEREKARLAIINLRNKYHSKRQRLRNLFHLRPFKNGVY